MGYGEVGGNGSVQVSVHLKDPSDAQTQEGAAAAVLAAADNANQRSPRAKALVPAAGAPGRAYRGKANQSLASGNTDNLFTVRIQFHNQQELNNAKALFAAADAAPVAITFQLQVRDEAGQVHVSWLD